MPDWLRYDSLLRKLIKLVDVCLETTLQDRIAATYDFHLGVEDSYGVAENKSEEVSSPAKAGRGNVEQRSSSLLPPGGASVKIAPGISIPPFHIPPTSSSGYTLPQPQPPTPSSLTSILNHLIPVPKGSLLTNDSDALSSANVSKFIEKVVRNHDLSSENDAENKNAGRDKLNCVDKVRSCILVRRRRS